MEAIGTPDPTDAKQYFSWWRMRNPYMTPADAKWFEDLKLMMQTNPEFTEEYLKAWGDGMGYSGRTTLSGMLATELPTTARTIKVPVLRDSGKRRHGHADLCSRAVFQGRESADEETDPDRACRPFCAVTHREEFLAALVKHVRSLD